MASTIKGLAVLGVLAVFMDPTIAQQYTLDMSGYTWLVVYAGIFAFIAAYGIGANDVANAYASSVGAKSLTIKQAVVLAVIFEFLGAVLLGSQVSETIRKGIADSACFEDNPQLLMWGMTCVIQAVGFWLILASYLEMPVSTTHTAVGGVIGMTMMCRSVNCVNWYETTDTFPYIDGVVAIVISWGLSPIASGIVAALLYGITYLCCLRWTQSFFLAKVLFPIIVAFTIGLNVVFIILKGSNGKSDQLGTTKMVEEAENGDFSAVLEVGAIAGAIAFFLTLCILPIVGPRAEAAALKLQEEENDILDGESKDADEHAAAVKVSTKEKVDDAIKKHNAAMEILTADMEQDPFKSTKTNVKVKKMHEKVKRHDARTEELFKYVQIFTAIIDSFSHGANDVANAMGPFAAVYVTYRNGYVTDSDDVGKDMYWILALGGAGIGVGLATYGYKIMAAIGVKLAAITPSRGFCIELGAAFVIIFGTAQGWPLSTTHCQVGATVGVGLFEGINGVNSAVLFRCLLGWVLTLGIAGLTAALLVGPSPDPIKELYCE
jgi:sodium-dependent phosphate transporter